MTTTLSRAMGLFGMALLIACAIFVSATGTTVSAQTGFHPRISDSDRVSSPQFGVAVVVDAKKEREAIKLQAQIANVQQEIEERQKHAITDRDVMNKPFTQTVSTVQIVKAETSLHLHPETGELVTEDEMKVYLQKKITETQIAIQLQRIAHKRQMPTSRKRGVSMHQIMFPLEEEGPVELTPRERDAMLIEIRQRIIQVQASLDALAKRQQPAYAPPAPPVSSPEQKEEKEVAPVVKKQEKVTEIEGLEQSVVTPKTEKVTVERTEVLDKKAASPFIVTLFVIALLLIVFGVPFFLRWREKQKEEEVHGENPWNK